MDILQLAGLDYYAHVYAKLQLGLTRLADAPLTQRERQCLFWAARGTKMLEIAKILGITTRTVVFHIENARSKLSASTVRKPSPRQRSAASSCPDRAPPLLCIRPPRAQ
ncbi:helix-turn-helix transcriptional regulator [Mesorhizobium sp.]|uniref:helix-turn-helix domain-containing protein n=1 Tax=Mesorhizobium sp. TaxID=1871066 RepID=UPI000FEA7F72|nr:helix-turn-helix transcriptional regulator [Mesorhizobium sp.]RWM45578.1 MAG: LuxR family transcriptional regulator [Mesorhizobium sp.]RWM58165.1 MAG: LuxR family transcriptional regulator [Mesorhizobium sp.]RWM58915.1 MAG: LuxR family transcriptional regulator [Mesorhizobium sp.]TIO70031.1 MAG: helix-turn-helix transcriptional regulator [Mesorhizobium sp.]TJV93920.1 MAG: helix-turn-helix transcriptional regulator [Mesorhizobium sp.]